MKEVVYKTILDPAELLSLILFSSGPTGRGYFWQTSDNKTLYSIDRIEVDCAKKVVNFKCAQGIELVPDRPLNVKINSRGLVFQVDPGSFIFSDNAVQFNCPSSGKAAETSETLSKKLTLRPDSEKASDGFEVQLLHFTPDGLGISCEERLAETFYFCSNYFIEAVNGNALIPSLLTSMSQIAPAPMGDTKVNMKVENVNDMKALTFMLHAFK